MSGGAGTPARPAGPRGAVEAIELTPAQEAFARRVAEAKATIPHVYFSQPLERPAPLPALVRACAAALREHPRLNAAYRDGRLEAYERVNVAVAIEAGGTLAFPVLRDADAKDRDAIERELAALAERAAEGALTSPELAGATFTIVDMSAHAASFAPTVARGQAAALGAGSASLTLACDHRAVQTSEGARFLGRVAGLAAAG